MRDRDYPVAPPSSLVPLRRFSALVYIHSQRIFHLDINPRNLLLATDGSPVRNTWDKFLREVVRCNRYSQFPRLPVASLWNLDSAALATPVSESNRPAAPA